MNVGFCGFGKLGCPVSVALATKHKVFAYDVNQAILTKEKYPHREMGPRGYGNFQPYLDDADLVFCQSLDEVTENCDIIFAAVQTPHAPEYEGVTRIPDMRADFDYSYLRSFAREIAPLLQGTDKILVIISTVLPGTMRREILPLLPNVKVVYNPFFVAMGTVMQDLLRPEFVLLGGDDQDTLHRIMSFWDEFYGKGICQIMSIESAELTKVAYNCWISAKIAFVNFLGEVCHKIPRCDVDAVTIALGKSRYRLISTAYMGAGMGDGGPCHPRDGIAMSWLAQELALSYDFCGEMMKARERQAEWLAEQIINLYLTYNLPVVLLGKAYKPETNLTTGSPALLLASMLTKGSAFCFFCHYDPFVDKSQPRFLEEDTPSLFVITTKHRCFSEYKFPVGSVVLDPFRYILPKKGVELIQFGVGK